MTTEAEPTRTPKLRFPEFRDWPEWTTHKLAEKAAVLKGKGIAKADLDPSGSLPCIRYGELYTYYGETISAVASRTRISPAELFLSQSNDVIIPSSGETKVDIATASCVLLDGVALGGDLNVIRSTLNGSFLSYYLNGPKKSDIAKVAQGDAVVHLYPHQLEKLEIAVPCLAEQKQIAECLTTLDELLGAESQKLDALKVHKKGLMQQLFPREGETLPRPRFPAFRKESIWQQKTIGLMLREAARPIEMADEKEYSLVTVKRRYGGVVSRECLTGRQILVKSQFLVEHNDFLISNRQIVHNACGLVPRDLNGSIVSNEYSVLTARKGCDIEFFNYFAQQPCVSESFLQCSVGIVIEKMLFKLDDWLNRKFLFPSFEEQRRIAFCLSSADELIAAQTVKVEALKTHKKGLMQQLFPSPAEAGA